RATVHHAPAGFGFAPVEHASAPIARDQARDPRDSRRTCPGSRRGGAAPGDRASRRRVAPPSLASGLARHPGAESPVGRDGTTTSFPRELRSKGNRKTNGSPPDPGTSPRMDGGPKKRGEPGFRLRAETDPR